MEKFVFLFFDLFVLGVFGWRDKRERSLALVIIVSLLAMLYCLASAYYTTAGFFTVIIFIALTAKFHLRKKR